MITAIMKTTTTKPGRMLSPFRMVRTVTMVVVVLEMLVCVVGGQSGPITTESTIGTGEAQTPSQSNASEAATRTNRQAPATSSGQYAGNGEFFPLYGEATVTGGGQNASSLNADPGQIPDDYWDGSPPDTGVQPTEKPNQGGTGGQGPWRPGGPWGPWRPGGQGGPWQPWGPGGSGGQGAPFQPWGPGAVGGQGAPFPPWGQAGVAGQGPPVPPWGPGGVGGQGGPMPPWSQGGVGGPWMGGDEGGWGMWGEDGGGWGMPAGAWGAGGVGVAGAAGMGGPGGYGAYNYPYGDFENDEGGYWYNGTYYYGRGGDWEGDGMYGGEDGGGGYWYNGTYYRNFYGEDGGREMDDGYWYNGTYYYGGEMDGYYENDFYEDGYWYNGTFHYMPDEFDEGYWYNGTWYYGPEMDDGYWYNGTFYYMPEMDDGYWYNGTFYYGPEMDDWMGGDDMYENGFYYNGTFYPGEMEDGYWGGWYGDREGMEMDEGPGMWWQRHHPRWRDPTNDALNPAVPPMMMPGGMPMGAGPGMNPFGRGFGPMSMPGAGVRPGAGPFPFGPQMGMMPQPGQAQPGGFPQFPGYPPFQNRPPFAQGNAAAQPDQGINIGRPTAQQFQSKLQQQRKQMQRPPMPKNAQIERNPMRAAMIEQRKKQMANAKDKKGGILGALGAGGISGSAAAAAAAAKASGSANGPGQKPPGHRKPPMAGRPGGRGPPRGRGLSSDPRRRYYDRMRGRGGPGRRGPPNPRDPRMRRPGPPGSRPGWRGGNRRGPPSGTRSGLPTNMNGKPNPAGTAPLNGGVQQHSTVTRTKAKSPLDPYRTSPATNMGILFASIIGFVLIVSPIACLIHKYRQTKKAKKRTFLRRPELGSVDEGIMDAMVRTELGVGASCGSLAGAGAKPKKGRYGDSIVKMEEVENRFKGSVGCWGEKGEGKESSRKKKSREQSSFTRRHEEMRKMVRGLPSRYDEEEEERVAGEEKKRAKIVREGRSGRKEERSSGRRPFTVVGLMSENEDSEIV